MNVDKEIKQIDAAIAELVYDKAALKMAYNYYHAKRDVDQFRHIEENYGIGVPTGVSFNPLVRPHIDRLVGEYLGLNQDLNITCKDQTTLSNIMRDKKNQIDVKLYNYLKQYINNSIIAPLINNKESSVDPFIEKEMQKVADDVNESYISEYEITAQKLLKYIKQSKNIDLDNKMQSLLTDLCISGTAYYRVRPSISGDNIVFEALNPLDTFVEKNPNSEYLADSRRAVIRRFMSVEDIIAEYHKDLNDEHIKILKEGNNEYGGVEGDYVYVTGSSENRSVWDKNHKNILGGLEVHPLWSGNSRNYSTRLYTVYDVEWIDVDYKTGFQTRHSGTKIGENIYITRGEDTNIIRTKDAPNKCRLSVNGLFFLDKNGEPNSIILKTSDLQNRFDLLSFYKDNLIASSGTVGDWVDLAFVPQVLGVELPERLQKWLAYKKQGLGLIDSSQEGAQMMNTIFNGYDDTVKAQSIQAIELAMQSIQQQVSMITGVLPEAMAQYEQRDAVSNVQLGVRTTMLLTKQLYKAMDVIYKEANYDMLNLAKLVWPDGITGTIVLGGKAEIFTALPEYYTITDFDLHIEDSARSFQDKQSLMSISGELVRGGVADLADITEIITATGMTELKRTINRSIAKKKAENDMIGQLQQQIQQYDQTMKDMEKNLKTLQQQNEQLNQELEKNNKYKLDLEAARISIEREKVKNEKDYNDKVIESKQQQIQAQVAQIYDTNPYNDKIKSIV